MNKKFFFLKYMIHTLCVHLKYLKNTEKKLEQFLADANWLSNNMAVNLEVTCLAAIFLKKLPQEPRHKNREFRN